MGASWAGRRLTAAAALTAAALVGGGDAGVAAAGHSPGELAAANEAIESARIPGTVWYVDDARAVVTLVVDPSVGDGDVARIRERAGSAAAAITVERMDSRLVDYVAGGDPVYLAAGRCTLGFNLTGSWNQYFLTAGHCVDPSSGAAAYTDAALSTVVGLPVKSNTMRDYGLMAHANPAVAQPGTVGAVDVAGVLPPVPSMMQVLLGLPVAHHGGVSGVRAGKVTAVNVSSASIAGGLRKGQIMTNICGQPGDSGGPLRTNVGGAVEQAVGVISNGPMTLDCSAPGNKKSFTLYAPVVSALAEYDEYGLSVH
ncbi:alpha-lytic protease prodomain-containing protein [Frankia sp. CNm7]|uniref:Alpha-lytic protease prodomain-containing protein n=1 Tax=Frankia nepalensis TaxID=1836974 RepID=A0A937US35_9ACTN|nr:S1 family peptidase [Frankia nepalensis]MBL7499065.1 alpha-lytic protease prodomain-containing protein [Frankia nepalensis]MBL7519460.1 alpha-lytic protease prodomain-containing protein [Frankia nepalensis]MBL7632027.1 alpha-lytic protease prodomain-containing protein [Frankia nepalensis]